MEELDISYNDNGFENIMSSLRELRTISILLFVIGVAAAFFDCCTFALFLHREAEKTHGD